MSPRQFPPITFRCPKPPAIADGQRNTFCAACGKTVHNLSALSQPEQDDLLTSTPDACVRYKRPRIMATMAAAALLFGGSAAADSASVESTATTALTEPFEVMLGGITSDPPPNPVPSVESVFREEALPAAERPPAASPQEPAR